MIILLVCSTRADDFRYPTKIGNLLYTVVRGGLLPTDFNGRHSNDIPKRYTGARDTTFARSARSNWIPKRDGYIHTNYFRDATQN